jgi:putative ABC transport system permease protein
MCSLQSTRFRFWLWLIRAIGVIVPLRLRANWRREWEAELRHREELLAEWDRLDWRSKLDLLRRSTSAFWDALWLQPKRLEDEMIQDLRYGARMLLKNPGGAAVAVITLALGIGANTAIFSMVDALLLRPLPYHAPERLVILAQKSRQGRRNTVSYPNFSDWRERAHSFEEMAVARIESFNLTGVERPVQLRGRMVSGNFFHLLGVQPQLGRAFAAEDDRYGAPYTVLLSHGMWREKFGGDANVIGRKLQLNGEPYEVIGVLPKGFEYFRADDVYTPIGPFLIPQTGMTDRGTSIGGMLALGRLRPGVTLAQANSEMAGLAAQLEREHPAVNSGISAQAEALQDVMSEDVRQTLWVLLGAVGFILLIACVNVASLLLAQAAERRQEIALRLALGAGRSRIVRQLLSESLLLALLGAGFGVVIGRWMLAGLLALAPNDIPHLSRVSLNLTVLLFTLGVAGLTSVLCGLAPAMHAARADLHTALKEGRSSSAGASRAVMRKTLLVVEVSLALALLAGAGLLTRSMQRALAVDPGFNPDNLLTMRVMLTDDAYPAPRRLGFYDECLARINALPGVRGTALTISLPIDGSFWNAAFFAADKPAPPRDNLPNAAMAPVTPNYFELMGIRLLKGRAFTSADNAQTPHVAVINESFARRIWPGEDPIGKRFRHGYPEYQSPWREVVGVVADIKLDGVESGASMQAYFPFAQETWSNFSIVARTTGDPLQSAASVERAIHTIDKDLPVFEVRSMDQLMGASLAQRRLTLTVLGSFAALALLLAGVGIYGVIAYSVRQRTRELGIRMALGAQRRDVSKLIIVHGLKLAVLGVALGLCLALALTRWMESLLFEVRPTDPLTFTVIALVLLLVALLACWLPARRATKVDPLVALRHE